MCYLSLRENAHGRAIATTFLEVNDTVSQSIEGIILTHSYVLARIVTSATLTNDDVACDALLATKNLNT